MPDFNIEYFRERAACEHALALTALHPKAIAAHAELAERYDALVRDGEVSNVLRFQQARSDPPISIAKGFVSVS